jgi:hypothetical protein
MWEAMEHARAWHPDLLRRVSELGLHFQSALAYAGPLTVANLRSLPVAVPPAAPVCTLQQPAMTTVAVLERWQLQADLGRSWANPFDPREVAVDAEFTTPTGVVERVPGYYFQDYSRSLVSAWRQSGNPVGGSTTAPASLASTVGACWSPITPPPPRRYRPARSPLCHRHILAISAAAQRNPIC